ncbi:transposase [candidate division KSB1 bacterium]|nr:transposase [candidate division KSB1 bacterium]
MKAKLKKHHRKSIRLKTWDYTSDAVYFITICTHNHQNLFSKIINGNLVYSNFGNIVQEEWIRTAELRNYIKLDEHIIMPNHFHGMLWICRGSINDELIDTKPPRKKFGSIQPKSLSVIIRSFKSAVTKRINEVRQTPGKPVWQRNFYEHIIRDEKDYYRIKEYILNNPLKWTDDRYYNGTS